MADFTIGEDFQAVIYGPFGEILLPLETSFSYEFIQQTPQVVALDGITYSRPIFGGWSGSIMFARSSNVLDQLAQQLQDTALSNGTIPDGTIKTQITEQSTGNTSSYTFNGVVYTIKNLGNFAAKKAVMQGLTFTAQKRT